MSSSNRKKSFAFRHRSFLAFLLVAYAVAAIILLACAGAWTIPVFELDQGGVQYKIGSQGYETNTANA
jgi:hypothetical protein